RRQPTHRTTTDEHDSITYLYSDLDEEDTKSAVSVILKLRGETCDIDCLYCYEKRKEAPGEPGSTLPRCISSPSSSADAHSQWDYTGANLSRRGASMLRTSCGNWPRNPPWSAYPCRPMGSCPTSHGWICSTRCTR